MSKPIKVYIAGPYSQPDPAENTRFAILFADRLLRAGYVPFVPHLTHFWHFLEPHPYRDWLDYENEWLEVCDCLLRMAGDSPGADAEAEQMRELGKPVFHTVMELAAAFAPPKPEMLPEPKTDTINP